MSETTRTRPAGLVENLRARCGRLPNLPGIYRMIDARGAVIYVGKARDLKKRVASYFSRFDSHTPKVRAMVSQVTSFEVLTTRNENEALLLESNLIKELRPRYNIVLRDDKSYPYIRIEIDHDFPRISFYRGSRREPGRYFGPYPSAGAVRATINLLQKLFMIRQCEDSYFSNRSRPCLQYQIKRCTAPCVGSTSVAEYAADIDHATLFLNGRSQDVIDVLIAKMERAAEALDYERAARLRDQIAKLQRVQAEQHVSNEAGDNAAGDFDIVVARARDGHGCVQVFFVRGGRNLGNKSFFPAHTRDATDGELLGAFVGQFYLASDVDRDIPPDILLSEAIDDAGLITTALSERRGSAVRLRHTVRGARAKWLEMAMSNADLALSQRVSMDADHRRRMEALRDVLDLAELPQRIECFDISHTRGEAPVAACVVFGPEGPMKSEYRRFNIEGITPGDDYAAMAQALTRRYSRLQREEALMPEVLLIDGGKGQVRQALEVLQALQIDDLQVVGVAKGSSRKPGMERLIMHDGSEERILRKDAIALHLIQHIRDEAHRFAIEAHRRSRARSRSNSPLQQIPGVGAKRRQRLLQHFGGLRGLSSASVDDIRRVPGISQQLAQHIFEALH